MGIVKDYQRRVGRRYDHKPDGIATRIRGFVPVTGQDWLNETTSEGTYTVSLSGVISTSAVAVALVQRLQDNAVNSFAEVRAKASVDSSPAAKHRLVCNNTSSTGPQQAHSIIPVNSDREVLWQLSDAKDSALQTASLGILGYYI